ncbi:HNH endonuclease [Paenibacillus apiarius]|uniref:HNH endonuclease n=1 Tax=Paenibacillus apiarius TaxID=46240 RepID=UPI003B3B0D57
MKTRDRRDEYKQYDKYKRNKEAKAFYNSTAWKKCRKLALKRDHYLCQECLRNMTLTSADMVHHIRDREEYPELALVIDNLESLCNPCHNKEHPEKGGGEKKQTTKRKVRVIKAKANREVY